MKEPSSETTHEPPRLAVDELARWTFHGAAGEVTGSCHVLETRSARVLFDCGMYQGGRAEEAKNREPFPLPPDAVDAVVLSHAHIDHSGLLPRLVAEGFAGPIHVTTPTADLLAILLPDSAHIQEIEAKRAARNHKKNHPRARPLYTGREVEATLPRLVPHAPGETFEVVPGLSVRFVRVGHILGAAAVEIRVEDEGVTRTIVFSGDVGREREPVLRDPEPPREADLVVLESTYGDREHKSPEASLDELADVLNRAAESGESVIVPVFAVGRAQEILYRIDQFEREGRIPVRPVFLDSPMAIHATEIYEHHAECFDETLRALLKKGDEPLEPAQLSFCRTPDESKALNDRTGIVILAASGMCEAGRVVHHLKNHLPRPGSHVVIVGFQARGTTGRALVDGAHKVRILGEEVDVRAEVHTIGGFSAHADQRELTDWVSPMLASGARLALVHGEPESRSALARHLAPRANGEVFEPLPGDRVSLRRRGAPVAFETRARRAGR